MFRYTDTRAEIRMRKVEVVAGSLVLLVKTITTPAIPTKKTADCFTNTSRYYYHHSNLDAWLPKDQPAQPKSTFSIWQLTEPDIFKQAVENFLGVTGDIRFLAQTLKNRRHTTTLPTVESLIEQQEAGEDVGLWTNGWAESFFGENEDGSVSVVYVRRGGRYWRVYVFPLGYAQVWSVGYRFFFRNSDPVSL